MTSPTNDRREVLTVPWVVLEVDPEPVTIVRAQSVPAPDLAPAPVIEEKTNNASDRWCWLFVALSVVWFILTAVLLVAGVLTPIRGNVLAYFVLMAGLFLAAFIALTCPRESEDQETFWTWGGEPVGQCTPTRANMLTGR